MGAPHGVHWLKSIFDDKTIFYVLLSHKMYKMMQKITKKHIKKGVYQHLGVTLKLFLFSFFSFVSDGKSCFSIKKLISTSEGSAEHPFAGYTTLDAI